MSTFNTNTVKFYLAHETRDGGAVVGLDGWRVALIRCFSKLGGGCTYYQARGAFEHSNGRIQVEETTVFECSYTPGGELTELIELARRYGREAEQACVRFSVGDQVTELGPADFGAHLPLYREQFLGDEELEAADSERTRRADYELEQAKDRKTEN